MEKNEGISENPCRPAPDLPPEMMEQIFQYLSLKDLLSCRLVWKDHDPIMKEAIGKKMKPILFNVETEGLRDHLKNNPNSPVPDELQLKLTFEEDHETIKEICENLRGKIKHLKVDMNRDYRGLDREAEEKIADGSQHQRRKLTPSNARLLIHILEILGSSLETLDLGSLTQTFLQTLTLKSSLALAGNFNFPSLQKITMVGEEPGGKSGSEKLSVWNQLIFKSCGNKLKSFQLQRKRMTPCGRRWQAKQADVLEDLNEIGRLTQITSLGLQLWDSSQLGEKHKKGRNLDTLLKYENEAGGLQIEELHIDNSDWNKEDVEKLERILKMQSKKIKIFSLQGSLFTDLKMPVIEQLTSLKLPAEDCLMENFGFGKFTPKLKSLEMEIRGTGDERKKLFDETKLCKTLETLKINTRLKMWGHEDPLNLWVCEIFERNFPSITSLTLGNPGEEFLQRLWTAWPNLLKLDLTLLKEFEDLDQSLFSITPEWKRRVNKKVDLWWTLNQLPPGSQIQSICNLTKLQTLRIQRAITPKYNARLRRNQRRSERPQIESNFSEFSYFYGLKNLKHLKVFSINQGSTVPREEEISEEAREFIQRELPSLRIQSSETSADLVSSSDDDSDSD